ncbi:MAG: class I SAM-dependent methyltransferase [Acidimicrobiales bacterium]
MDAEVWNQRYATAEYVWRAEPNVFVAADAAGLPPGRALDLACGEGRNAVWLAEQGWTATGVDFSDAGIAKAQRLAADRGVEVTWEVADVLAWTPPPEGFDLVVVAYLQLPAAARRRAMAVAAAGVAPGGTLLVVAHDTRNLAEGTGGPQHAEVLYTPAEVVADLAATGTDLVIERAETVERSVDGADRPALDCLVRARRSGP